MAPIGWRDTKTIRHAGPHAVCAAPHVSDTRLSTRRGPPACLHALDDWTRDKRPCPLGQSIAGQGHNSGSTTSRKRGLRRRSWDGAQYMHRVGHQIVSRLDPCYGPDDDCPPRLLGLRSPGPGSARSWMRCRVARADLANRTAQPSHVPACARVAAASRCCCES